MSTFTQKQMENSVINNVMVAYIKGNQMFTVYQIWDDASKLLKSKINYNDVRNYVESLINDYESKISGWTRRVQNISNPDNSVGKVGESPQIYHPIGANLNLYDPKFRLYNSGPSISKVLVKNIKTTTKANKAWTQQPVIKNKGLFKFKVWFNGNLESCNLVNPRGNGGKFVSNIPYESHGVLDSGTLVIVKQDTQGKLYAVTQN